MKYKITIALLIMCFNSYSQLSDSDSAWNRIDVYEIDWAITQNYVNIPSYPKGHVFNSYTLSIVRKVEGDRLQIRNMPNVTRNGKKVYEVSVDGLFFDEILCFKLKTGEIKVIE